MKTLNKKIKTTLVSLLSTFAIASGSAQAAVVEVLHDGDFESSSSSPSNSHILNWNSGAYGTWGVGDGFSIRGNENGISPYSGNSMLAFDRASSSSLDIYQIVDVSSFASQIDSGNVTADLSVFFNSTSSTHFGLRLLGWASAPTSFSGHQVLGGSVFSLLSDNDQQSWEQVGFSTQLPTGLRYLAFGMHEPASAPTGYADNASLKLHIADVPEPGSLSLLVLGALGIAVTRRRLSK